MKILFFISLFLLISCKDVAPFPVTYNQIYSISLKNKLIGYCTEVKNNYICEIFLKNKGKKFSYKIKMQRIGDLVKYTSPTVSFEKKIKSNYLIYPFLFKNEEEYKIPPNQKNIYYPENNIFVNKNDLSIKKIKNGYIATPFKYEKIDKLPKKIEHLDILEFREVKSVNKLKKVEYPSKYVISFNSDIVPPSDGRQKCRVDKGQELGVATGSYPYGSAVICELMNGGNGVDMESTHTNYESNGNSLVIASFIKKYKLKKNMQKDDLISKLIESLHKEIKYLDISRKMTTSEILDGKKGDCTEFSQVSVDVLRELRVNSKRIYGLIYKPQKKIWLYHSWVEYEVNNKIHAFDPVNKLAYINLNYLKLGEENKYGIIIIPLDIENLKFISID